VENISQLMDGELDAHSAQQALARLRQRQDMRDNWDVFHIIGDTLRGEGTLSREFGQRISRRLAEEPTVLAPARRAPSNVTAYALSAAASVAAVALVAWLALGTRSVSFPAGELAGKPVPPSVASAPEGATAPKLQLVSEPYDGTLNGYLMAHTGFSPSTVIQGVVPYIRAVAAGHSESTR
jgi:sigma-E factor negative regulatory protein RseA